MNPSCVATLSYSVRPAVLVTCVCQYTRWPPTRFTCAYTPFDQLPPHALAALRWQREQVRR
jgi:hypothetical protein